MAAETALVVRSRGQLRTAGLLAALVLLAAVSAASVAVGSRAPSSGSPSVPLSAWPAPCCKG